jgi:hypothetical protein
MSKTFSWTSNREIAAALEIVAYGRLHRKYTVLAFWGLDVRARICIS